MTTPVLQIGALSERFNQSLAAICQVHRLWEEADPMAFLQAHGDKFELVVTSAGHGCSAAQMAALPRLKAICNFGVGYDAIDLDVARQRGIAISNTPEVLDDCVADLAMGLILDSARRIAQGDRFVRAGLWGTQNFPLGRRVSGKRLGIVGLGRIGKAVAKRACGFDLELAYHNRKPDPSSPHRYEADLLELARWADFLLLTCVGGPSTHHLIDAAVLEALGADGTLINVARGSVVDEAALVAALQAGTLGGAALDVYEDEPRVPAALWTMPNVVLLPHIGSATEETRLAMGNLVLDNLQAFIARGELLTPV